MNPMTTLKKGLKGNFVDWSAYHYCPDVTLPWADQNNPKYWIGGNAS